MITKAVIEMPKHTKHKYEIKGGMLTLDRILIMRCPQNYGFIPNTMSEDGDPLDVFVVSEEPIQPGTYVNIEIIGVFECLDQGIEDNKVLANIIGHKNNDKFTELEIQYYLDNYKKGFEVIRYNKEFTKKQLENYKVSLKS